MKIITLEKGERTIEQQRDERRGVTVTADRGASGGQ